jgi:tetratricopeptide (TPR) repeat protein
MHRFKLHHLIPVLIVAAGLLAYSNSFRYGFLFDDAPRIVDNQSLRQLWPPWELLRHTSRPVVQLSLALNYAIGQLNPLGYRLVNTAIHILAALTLFGVVRRTLERHPELVSRRAASSPQPLLETSCAWLAGVVALTWLLHPLQTQSVTYIIQRGESLMGLFYLLTLYCMIRSDRLLPSRWWQCAALISCALGMATKPVMATAPVVALLYDRTFLAASWRELFTRRWPLYAGLASTWLVLWWVLTQGAADWQTTAGFAYEEIPPLSYALTQPGVVLHYLRLAVWPASLCFDYGWHYGWPTVHTFREAWPAALALGALLATSAWAWRRHPALGFLSAWFFLILAPTSSVLPVADVAFEHRMYLSLAAVVAGIVVGGFRLAGNSPRAPAILGVAGAAVVVALMALTIRRNRDYRSELAIWADTAAKCPGNPRAQNNLGKALLGEGKAAEAIPYFAQAIQIKPDYAIAYDNLGAALAQMGRVSEAVEQFEVALRIQPELGDGHYNLGRALSQLGQPREAIPHLEQALLRNPQDANAHYELANALAAVGEIASAIQHWEAAVRLVPDFVNAHNNLGVALAQGGRFQEASEQFKRVLQITPDDAAVHFNLANVLLSLNQPQAALAEYEQTLRIQPDHSEARKAQTWLQARLSAVSGARPPAPSQ